MTDAKTGTKTGRKTEREELIFYLKISDAQTRREIGRLVDITPKGLKLVSELKFFANQKVYLVVHFISPIRNQTYLNIQGEVRWVNPSQTKGYFDTGVMFINVTADQSDLIKALIERLSFSADYEDEDEDQEGEEESDESETG